MSSYLSSQLSGQLGSRLEIGGIEFGLLNRILLEDVQLFDQEDTELLQVSRLSARFDILPLFQGKISISNIQLFGFDAFLHRKDLASEPNFKFLLDAFASKDTVSKSEIDLRINSLLLRRGNVSYHLHSADSTPGKFNANHLDLRNITANISLKALTPDSLNAAIRRFSVEEVNSGFDLDKLSFKAVGNHQGMKINDFQIRFPNTSLQMDTIRMHYDSLSAFKHFAKQVRFDFHLLPSPVTLSDISPIIPLFQPFVEPMNLEVQADGTLNELRCSLFELSSDEHFRLKGNLDLYHLTDSEQSSLSGNLSQLHADSIGIAFLLQNLNKEYEGVPAMLQNLGTVDFIGKVSGNLSDMQILGETHTQLGSLFGKMHVASDSQTRQLALMANLNTTDFELGKLVDDDKLGNITLHFDVDSRLFHQAPPRVQLKGVIDSLQYNNYKYENITLDGQYNSAGFSGEALLDDPNARMHLNGQFDIHSTPAIFNFQADIAHFRPNDLRLTSDYEGGEFSFTINGDFQGKTLDELKGTVSLDSLLYTDADTHYFMDKFLVTARQDKDKRKHVDISSDFIEGKMVGTYRYNTLPATLNALVHRYLPSLVAAPKSIKGAEPNVLDFHFDVNNTTLLSDVFQLPITLYGKSELQGSIDENTGKVQLSAHFPRVRYKDRFIESGMVRVDNHSDNLKAQLRMNELKQNDAMNYVVDLLAQNDSLQAKAYWGNTAAVTNSGQIVSNVHFSRSNPANNAPLRTRVNIAPSHLIISDTLWHIHPSEILSDSGKIYVNDFFVNHEHRHLRVNGILSEQLTDTIRVDLQDINIAYIFDIADLGVDFSGIATGPAYGCGMLKEPVMFTDLNIRNLGLNNGLLGNTKIRGEWHNDVKGIHLNAHLQEPGIADTYVDGYIYPLKPNSGLDLNIVSDGTNLRFIHGFLGSLTSDFHGRATGNAHLYGTFKTLNLEGNLFCDASMKVDELNTTYQVKDSVFASTNGLTFRNARIYDTEGNSGVMNGYLNYQHFKNVEYQLNFDVNNMLLMNTHSTPDAIFYGTVYGTGNVQLSGTPETGLNVNVAATTNRNTLFTYMYEGVYSATSDQFITFVDKTPKRETQHEETFTFQQMVQQEKVAEEEEDDSETDLRINLQAEVTPDAVIRVVMDPATGDGIRTRGTGNVRADFYNKGDIRMFGNYNVTQGTYQFSIQEVIRKEFNLKEGSSISFSGDPTEAVLDLHAGYVVNTVSLNDLISDASSYVDKTNIKVECLMNLTGQLSAPEVKLSIDFPQERDEVQALVRNYISTEEQMNMQILYLLSIGKFYAATGMETTNNSNMMSSVLSSTLSGQLSNALSQIINSNEWNLGTNFTTGERGWTDVEFETMLSGQMLNNRLRINGNFGYRDNPLANSNFVGDFEAEWLIVPSGDIRLRAYNETNDRYYTKTNLNTQGIGIIFSKDFTRWNEFAFWNKWRLKWLKRRMELKERNAATDGQQPEAKQKREGK